MYTHKVTLSENGIIKEIIIENNQEKMDINNSNDVSEIYKTHSKGNMESPAKGCVDSGGIRIINIKTENK